MEYILEDLPSREKSEVTSREFTSGNTFGICVSLFMFTHSAFVFPYLFSSRFHLRIYKFGICVSLFISRTLHTRSTREPFLHLLTNQWNLRSPHTSRWRITLMSTLSSWSCNNIILTTLKLTCIRSCKRMHSN